MAEESENKQSDAQPNRIRVFMRVRPPNKDEENWFRSNQCRPILRDESGTPDPETTIIIDKSGKKYEFDKVFRYESTQKQMFKDAALPTLENVFSGYCGAVLAYGQTGTGKTHTMQGYGEEKGIIPRSAEYIFSRISKQTDTNFTVRISFVQIYLDKLQDLFKPDAPEVNINPETERVELPGIVQHEVHSSEEMMKYFYWGEKHRVTRATLMNPTSSRGHAALIVNLEMSPKENDGSQGTRHGKLVLVDLAGYERFALTGITTGIAAEEAKKINASLLALGSVVNALAEACTKKGGQHHIPYRNAKLTRLLKDCLGGTSVTAIILTIGPADKYNQETSGTLYFGWRAMCVKVDARIKQVFDPSKYTSMLKDKLAAAQARVKTMASWWSRSNPKDYAKYIEKYGEPELSSGVDVEEEDILEAMQRSQSVVGMSRGAPAGGAASGPSANSKRAVDTSFDDDVDVEDPSANAQVNAVRKNWNEELMHQRDQSLKDEEMLRLRHIQDFEEARKAGANERVLANLKREHEEEMQMMREQNMLLKKEILRQKQKEEVVALLQSVQTTAGATLTRQHSAKGSVMEEEQKRVYEIVDHLQETCENKDEVLNRMFELICFYEAQINDYKMNVSAIAEASAGASPVDGRSLAEAQKREDDLKTLLFLKNEEIENLKRRGGAGGAGGVGSVSPDGVDFMWTKAINISPSTQTLMDLQVQARLMRDKLQEKLREIIEYNEVRGARAGPPSSASRPPQTQNQPYPNTMSRPTTTTTTTNSPVPQRSPTYPYGAPNQQNPTGTNPPPAASRTKKSGVFW